MAYEKAIDDQWLFKRILNILWRGIVVIGIGTGVILCIGVAAYAMVLPFLEFNSPIHNRLMALPPFYFLAHTFGGGLALILVPLQLFTAQRYRLAHVIFGRAYVACILLSSIGGYYMAWDAFGGLSSTLALSILATLWWGTTLIAVGYAIKGNIRQHRRWMLRSAALTVAAVTLRLTSPIFHGLFDPVTAQQGLYWSCWIINLVIIELWIKFKLPKTSQ